MKSLKLSIATALLLGVSGLQAYDIKDIKTSASFGVTNSEVEVGSVEDDTTGTEIGVSNGISVCDKTTIAVDLDGSFYNDYNIYSVGLVAKYDVTNKINVGAGVSYNIIDPDGSGDNDKETGFQLQGQYNITDKIGVYVKYKTIDLDNDVDMTNISSGIAYKF